MIEGDPKTVGILLYHNVEVLDFAGPYEVFSVASPVGYEGDAHKLFTVKAISESEGLITLTGGLRMQPDCTFDEHPPLDILVVPGGMGSRQEIYNTNLLNWVREQDKTTELTASVCTGAFILAEAGLLKARRATTHWRGLQWLKENYPEITIIDNERVIDEGHIITSAGISAGIDMSLHIVSRFYGKETAIWTARIMEYEWLH